MVLVAAGGCSTGADRPPAEDPDVELPKPVESPSAMASTSAASPPSTPAEELGDRAAPRAGRFVFKGMVRGAKDGYDVRGISVDASLRDVVLKSSADGIPADPEWILGAVVKVTGQISKHDSEPPESGGLAKQGREGTWYSATVERAELVARAEVVEGTLANSKGLFSIDRYLVSREDLAWSLVGSGGGKAGDQVKLWGQPRIVVCNPNEQCLTTGSLPLFDVARATKLP